MRSHLSSQPSICIFQFRKCWIYFDAVWCYGSPSEFVSEFHFYPYMSCRSTPYMKLKLNINSFKRNVFLKKKKDILTILFTFFPSDVWPCPSRNHCHPLSCLNPQFLSPFPISISLFFCVAYSSTRLCGVMSRKIVIFISLRNDILNFIGKVMETMSTDRLTGVAEFMPLHFASECSIILVFL
jgi:hypothetical protein